MAQKKVSREPTFKVTPKKSIKIDGVLYVGGQEKEVTAGTLRKMQDLDVAVITDKGESTVRSLLSDKDQTGLPREFVKGGTDGEPYGTDDEHSQDGEGNEDDLDTEEEETEEGEEEEVEEEVEEEDPVTKAKTKTTKKVKRPKKRGSRR